MGEGATMANREEQERNLGRLDGDETAAVSIDEGRASEAASSALSAATTNSNDSEKKRMAELAKVKVNKEDIKYLMDEFEIKAQATALLALQEAGGDVLLAAQRLLAQ